MRRILYFHFIPALEIPVLVNIVKGKSLLESWGTTFIRESPLCDLLQNHMSTSHTITGHAQEV